MNILNPKSIEVLTELLLEDLPRAILDIICQNQKYGLSEGRLIGLITRQLPSNLDRKYVRELCISCVRWYLHNGDISNAGNRRYVVLPLYGISQPVNEGFERIKICGDIRLDDDIDRVLKPIGYKLKSRMVPWSWKSRDSNKVQFVGLRRNIDFPIVEKELVFRELSQLSISIVNPNDIRDKLPSIHQLCMPPKTSYLSIPPSWGYWSVYNPKISDPDRWVEINNWQREQFCLLKWKADIDLRDEQGARYFLHSGFDRMAELSRQSAYIWMAYQDYQNNNPRDVLICKDYLLTPSEIPEAHQYWLQLLAENWHKTQQNRMRKYSLLFDPQGVARTIENSLGMQIVELPTDQNIGV